MCLSLIRIKKAPNNLLNKISDDWNKDKLALLITYLKASNLDVLLTGFYENDITKLSKSRKLTVCLTVVVVLRYLMVYLPRLNR